MRQSTHLAIILVLFAALAGSPAAWAQAHGRGVIRVLDVAGNPIEGALITVTQPELPKFLIETKTKKKGSAALAFADATKTYVLKIEKEGYETVEMPFKAELRTSTEKEVTLRERGQEVALPEGGTELRRFTPSEKMFNAGVELLQGGDLEGAKAKFNEAIAENAKLAPAHAALAAVYLEQENYNEAIASANRFHELEPGHPTGYRVLYDAYRGLGQDAEAEAALAQLTAMGDSGDSAVLLYNEGVEALRIGQNATAKERFTAALAADPQLVPALVALGKVILDEGDFAAAAEKAEQALELDAENYTALLIAYESYKQLGDTENENAAFDKLAAAHPQRVAQVFYDKGVELFNAGEIRASITSFERALEADAGTIRAHYHLGIAYVNVGENDKAKGHLTQFLEMAPDDPDVATATEMLKYLGS
jgi:tetratricopeptide (TPR) repeat protein